jgi:hypothetical protein
VDQIEVSQRKNFMDALNLSNRGEAMKDTKILEIIDDHFFSACIQIDQCGPEDASYHKGVADGLMALRSDINELMKLEKSLMKYRAKSNKL